MENTELFTKIKEKFSDIEKIEPKDPKWVQGEELQVKVSAVHLKEIVEFVKIDLGFDLLSFMTAVDWIKENRFEMVYYFNQSQDPKNKLYIKVDLPREGEPSVPSITSLYEGADWQERETYDLYGIRFEGHPHLKRILLWEGYPGWPLRKDYVHTQDKYDNGEEIGIVKEPAAVPGENP